MMFFQFNVFESAAGDVEVSAEGAVYLGILWEMVSQIRIDISQN
jgi:hypothetical protein